MATVADRLLLCSRHKSPNRTKLHWPYSISVQLDTVVQLKIEVLAENRLPTYSCVFYTSTARVTAVPYLGTRTAESPLAANHSKFPNTKAWKTPSHLLVVAAAGRPQPGPYYILAPTRIGCAIVLEN